MEKKEVFRHRRYYDAEKFYRMLELNKTKKKAKELTNSVIEGDELTLAYEYNL